MLPLEYPGRWGIAGLLLISTVLVAATLPSIWFLSDYLRIHAWFGLDKWAHALTFAFLAAWFSGQYRRASYWRIAVGLAAFGILIELVQSTITYRSAEWHDVTADVVGIVFGLLIAFAGLGGWSQRFESWLGARTAA